MKNARKRLMPLATAMAALFTLFALSATGFAQGHMGGGHMYYGLSAEQQAAAQKIHAEHYAATAPLQQQLYARQAELDAQIYAQGGDDKKVQSLTREVGDIRAKLYAAQVDLRRALAKAGIPATGMGGMGCGMMGGGMTSGGMGPHHSM